MELDLFLPISPVLSAVKSRLSQNAARYVTRNYRGRSNMRSQVRSFVVLLAVTSLSSATAQELAGEDMRSLDGQVQEIKSDVLNIASELNVLEERLLYPSHTQLALFVELEEGETLRLDAVEININGELATHHIYSFKELEALQQGGVQRVYTGNVPTGAHEISVTIKGKFDNGADFDESQSFAFNKGVRPKALGITVGDGALGSGGIRIGDW